MKIYIFFIGIFLAVPLWGKTCAELEDLVVQHPDDYKALYNLGVSAFHEGDVKKAYDAFSCLTEPQRVSQLRKNEAIRLFYNAGNAAAKLEKWDKALHFFEEVLFRDPEHENARKKRDYIKKMLEQKKEQEKSNDQQKKNEQDKKDTQQQDEQQAKDQNKKNGNEPPQKKDGESDKKDQGKDNQPPREEQQDKKDKQNSGSQNDEQKGDQGEKKSASDQNKNEQEKENSAGAQGQSDSKKQENGSGEKQLSGRQQQLLMLADQIDKNVQRELVRQQTGMQRRGGEHEW